MEKIWMWIFRKNPGSYESRKRAVEKTIKKLEYHGIKVKSINSVIDEYDTELIEAFNLKTKSK